MKVSSQQPLSLFLSGFCSTALVLQMGFLREPIVCFCPLDFCCSLCFLLFQSLITPLATFADTRSTSSGPMSGCEEFRVANFFSSTQSKHAGNATLQGHFLQIHELKLTSFSAPSQIHSSWNALSSAYCSPVQLLC